MVGYGLWQGMAPYTTTKSTTNHQHQQYCRRSRRHGGGTAVWRRLLWCATNHRPTTDPLQQRGKWFCLPRRSNAASFVPSFVQRTLHSAGPAEGPKI